MFHYQLNWAKNGRCRFEYPINIFNLCRNHLLASKFQVFTELFNIIILP